jgi:flagellar basal-body rod protein FlgG
MALRALMTAASGMEANELLTDVISNNLANIGTTAFKRNQAAFQDLLYQNEKRLGTNPVGEVIVPTGLQVGLGVKTAAIYRINEQGEFRQTGNTYDLAIKGKGYFVIEMPDGTQAFTRAGNFTVSSTGTIVTLDGFPVLPSIQIPAETLEVTISEYGVVSTRAPQTIDWAIQGTLELANFNNESGLQAMGQNLFTETDASGAPITSNPGEPGTNNGTLMQGWLENSNVNPITEITNLITAQRSYEMGSKVIQAVDEMMLTVNSLKK